MMNMTSLSSEIVSQASAGDPPWAVERRKKAFEQFNALPLPHEREEAWRYTDLRALDLSKLAFVPGSLSIASDNPKVRVHGISAAEHLPELEKILSPADKFSSLNAASAAFAYVHVPAGASATISAKSAGNVHLILVLDTGSTTTFYDDFASATDSPLLSTSAASIIVREGAVIDYYGFQDLPLQAYDFSYKRAHLARDAAAHFRLLVSGAALSRTEVDMFLSGHGARSSCTALFLGSGQQHTDLSTNAFHTVPGTTCSIAAHGALKDRATAVHRGLIRIDAAAPKTESFLESHSLLLNEHTSANPIPSLIIENNDVRASHSASVGQIDEEKMFYLLSRGLTRPQAERLIIGGFFAPALQRAPEEIKERFERIIDTKVGPAI